jgi:hypothetical protein
MIAAQLKAGIFTGIAPDRFSWNIPLSLVVREGKPLPAAARILRSRLLEEFGAGQGLRSAA